MATIQETITLNDQMSAKLDRIIAHVNHLNGEIRQTRGGVNSVGRESTGASPKVFALGSIIQKAFMAGAIYNVARGIAKISDTASTTAARLNLITDASHNLVQVQDMVFQSAQRARVSIVDMSDSVAKLRMNAPDTFGNLDETVQFAETLSKTFKISGADANTAAAATRQLVQALGSGVLRGDEFVSVMEGAPMVAQMIAKEMGISVGELREYSSEGRLTADIIKRAFANSAEDVNRMFEKIPVTFADIASSLQNTAFVAFQPVLHQLSNLINSEEFQQFMIVLGNLLMWIGEILGWLFSSIGETFGALNEGSSSAIPLVGLLGGAMVAAFNPPLGILIMIISLLGILSQCFAEASVSAAEFGGTALGVLFGVMAGVSNFILFFVKGTAAIGKAAADTAYDFCIFWENAFLAVIKGIEKLVSVILDKLAGLAEKIDGAFGTNAAGWLRSKANDYSNISESVKLMEYKNPLKSAKDAWNIVDFIDLKGAYDDGYGMGSKAGKAVSDKFKDLGKNLLKASDASKNAALMGANGTNATGVNGSSGTAPLDKIATNTEKTAANTADMRDTLKNTAAELKYLRELQERQAINKYTTPTINVTMNNSNNIASDMDLDGVIHDMANGIRDAIASSPEGSHI